ncbi:DNA-binding response regulator [Enterovibrio norvegicus FF-162]|uniref:DNA-binding response regulator n=1 Tax=Enterovibrio norvegicus FF-454 TaxID=1185651 RepID=A0A1E5BX95_9GAMM|nr:two-component system response regulator TorR [Enterovibrio norvegicus]OEE57800.1 DNA-binding response regulator [Enterovibrio norvegicus FF-454]OEE86945.1 DNA-binding response regulator [Enterovibrio norvegicus FF-162]
MSYHILVVDDEVVTRTMVGGYFEKQGYSVSQAADGKEMHKIMNERHVDVDLVLLDINLPGEDGLMLTRDLRSKSDVGIILITARTDSIDRIVGLEMGADDYCTKPLELRELLVRVRNLLWRISRSNTAMLVESLPPENDKIVNFSGWTFDIERRALSREDDTVKLTKAEYEMLVAFTANPNRVLSRERILNLISHRVDAPNDRTVDVLVRRLRNKIEAEPKKPQLFITVHGEGYMFAGR